MFNFFHNLGLGIMSTVLAITGIFHQAPPISTSTPPTQTATSSITETLTTSSVIAPVTKQEMGKSPKVDNSAQIQAQVQAEVQAQVQAQLKIKEKADADAQAVIKAEADRKALLDKQWKEQAEADAQKLAELKAKQEQSARDAEALRVSQQQAENEAIQAKKEKLNAINLKIANLNAKYASDSSNLRNNGNIASEIVAGRLQNLYNVYLNDYNKLMAEYQQVQYSN